MAAGLDEVIFRAAERVELLQVQLISGANQIKDFAYHIQQLIIEAWNNPALKDSIQSISDIVRISGIRALESTKDAWRKAGVENLPSPAEILERMKLLFGDKMWRHTVVIFGCGIVCGTLCGVSFGLHCGSRTFAVPHFRALHSLPDGTAVVVEDGAGANVHRSDDVVIRINSFSVQPLDRDVLKGRAKRLRNLIRPRNKDVTIGRSFSGVVVEMGSAVTQMEIGDEVWGALAEWEGGGAQEMLSAPARRVGRSPRALLPPAAASLPYSGALALHYLNRAELNSQSIDKRVLIIGAENASGCVMLQLLKNWGCKTTAVCDRRAQKLVTALGAEEALTSEWCDEYGTTGCEAANACLTKSMIDDLSTRPLWNVVFICRAPASLQASMLRRHLVPNGMLADLRPKFLYTDNFGSILTSFYGMYLTIRRNFSWLRGMNSDVDFLLPAPLDAEMLDRLAVHVEAGELQTVVDKVYALKDFELALAHTCSMGAIGCTVVRIS